MSKKIGNVIYRNGLRILLFVYLSGETGDVQRRVALLGGGVDVGAARQEFPDDGDVALLGGEVERVEAVGVARVDVGGALEELEHLLQVAAAGGAQEARIVVGLKDKVDGERDMIVIESGATEVVKLEANKMSAPLSSSVKRLCGSCGKRGRDVGFMQSISVAVFKLREFSYKLVAKNH